MVTQSKFHIFLDGRSIGTSHSLEDANDDLTQAVLNRALRGISGAVVGEIKDSDGQVIQSRKFGEAIYDFGEDL